MALIDSFEKNGAFLFRYRGQLPLLFFIVVVPVTYFYNYDFLKHSSLLKSLAFILCIAFILLGHILRILIVGFRSEHTSGRNRHEQVAHRLNVSGWYSVVRHPLYFANFLIWMGLSFYLVNPLLSAFLCVCYWLYYERIMLLEEKFLANNFEGEFTSWATNVPAFVPNIFLYKKSGNRFSIKTVCSNEYPSIVSSLTTLLVLILLRRLSMSEHFTWSLTDVYFALSILVFGLTFRIIKHRTLWFK